MPDTFQTATEVTPVGLACPVAQQASSRPFVETVQKVHLRSPLPAAPKWGLIAVGSPPLELRRNRMLVRLIKAAAHVLAALVLIGILLVAAAIGDLAISRSQPLTLPSPTGPSLVGRVEYVWVDQGRADSLSDRPAERRELLVWIWYPADVSTDSPTAPYLPPAWADAHDLDQGLARFLEADYSRIRTRSHPNALLASSAVTYPVIIMQPGMGPAVPDYTIFAENLASRGYIVVGLNPTYSSNLLVFPDGRAARPSARGTIRFSPGPETVDQAANRIQEVWAADVIFVMDQLTSMNSEPASVFYRRLALSKIGLFGHSFGGATAVRVCQLDARCAAAADLDGALFSQELGETIHQPVLFMMAEGCTSPCGSSAAMYEQAGGSAYYVVIRGARHFNFGDYPFRQLPLARMLFTRFSLVGSVQPARALDISNAYLLAFFDSSIRGIPSPLLEATSSPYPEVQFARRGPS